MKESLYKPCDEWSEMLTTPSEELSAIDRKALEQHIATCFACQHCYTVDKEITTLFHDLPVPDLPPGLPPRLLEYWQQEEREADQLAQVEHALAESLFQRLPTTQEQLDEHEQAAPEEVQWDGERTSAARQHADEVRQQPLQDRGWQVYEPQKLAGSARVAPGETKASASRLQGRGRKKVPGLFSIGTPRRRRMIGMINSIAAVLVIGLIIGGFLLLTSHRHATSGSGSLKLSTNYYALPVGNEPTLITKGPDNNLWFTEYTANGISKIGRITPSGSISEYPLSTANGGPVYITAGPDGNVWFTEFDANGNSKIGRITTSGVITEYSLPTANSGPQPQVRDITAGPDGNLWFTEYTANGISKIGRITPSGSITEFPLSANSSGPDYITAGPDGNLWFTVVNGKNEIGRITPSGVITEFSLPTASSGPDYITAGPDGNLWFTEFNGNKIGRITPGGVISEYALPTANGQPRGITAGPDGNLWFTEFNGNKIGRITPGGVISEYPLLTSNSQPDDIAMGSAGTLWFTVFNGNKIGRITIT